MNSLTTKLERYLPAEAAPIIADWISEFRIIFEVSRPRRSKLGYFRAPMHSKPAKISINRDLNPYSFLITTIHEFAHLGCYLKHKGTVLPHGEEWKEIYVEMLKPFLTMNIFPKDILPHLYQHISKPMASSCNCPHLSRALANYDSEPTVFLGGLQSGQYFHLEPYVYEFIEKRRTRCVCERVSDGRRYLISGIAKVMLTED